jgi:serine/threonine protein kinase
MRQIGEGTFASVYLAEEKYDRRLVAIKAINRLNCRELGEWSYLINELEVLKRLRTHQFVLRLYFAFEDVLNLLMEGVQRLSRHRLSPGRGPIHFHGKEKTDSGSMQRLLRADCSCTQSGAQPWVCLP